MGGYTSTVQCMWIIDLSSQLLRELRVDQDCAPLAVFPLLG
jgi:hypothetical protein